MNRFNKMFGLTKSYQHDIDDKSKKCKKCHQTVDELEGGLKLCSVIGKEEVARCRLCHQFIHGRIRDTRLLSTLGNLEGDTGSSQHAVDANGGRT